jgi:hypothetical protein
MTKSKSKQNADSGYDASAAVAALEKSVQRQMDAWTRYWNVAFPLVKDWRKRIAKSLAEIGEDITNGGSDISTEDTEKAFSAAGFLYQKVGGLGRDWQGEAANLLHYLWRLSYEHNTSGESIRNQLIDDFGLRSTTTKVVPESQLAKLNASQHRPLCVAESILKNECPRKRDETLATFSTELISNGYTVTIAGDKKRDATAKDIYAFIDAHWSELRGLTTSSAMVKVWKSVHGESADVLKRRGENRRKSREDRWKDAILTGKKTIAELSAASNIKAEDKSAIEGLVYKELGKRFGSRVIRVSSALYPLTKLEPFADENDNLRLADASMVELTDALKAAKTLVPAIEQKIKDKEAEDLAQEFTRLMSQAKNMTAEQRAMLQEALAQ